jgi:hypothetical protein
MFSLIITIISIALVAALALATIYYGGNAFNKGSESAKAAQLINEGQQLNGAFAFARAEARAAGTTEPADTAALISGNYLTQAPASFVTVASGVAQTAAVTDGVADAVVTKGGTRFADLAAATTGSAVYGVIGTDGSATQVVFYKY